MNRAAVKRRLVDVIGSVLTEVNVAYTWAGDDATDSTLWLGESVGQLDPETMGNDHLVIDEWTIRCALELHGFDDAEAAEAAVEDVLSRVDTVLRDARRLRRVPHLDDGDTEAYGQVRIVRLANVDGPFHTNPQLHGGDLAMGLASFELLCTSDL